MCRLNLYTHLLLVFFVKNTVFQSDVISSVRGQVKYTVFLPLLHPRLAATITKSLNEHFTIRRHSLIEPKQDAELQQWTCYVVPSTISKNNNDHVRDVLLRTQHSRNQL